MTDLEPGGPYSPERTAEVARMMAGAVRYLNHATLDRPGEALSCPADLDRVIAHLETMAQRMPQLLGQAASWIRSETLANRTEVTYGKFKDRPALAADVATMALEAAAARFGEAARALEEAHQITSAISGIGDD
jgi:hypothetical protein